MLTDTIRHSTAPSRFLARGAITSLGLFGLLRLAWTETHVVLPLTLVQAGVAERWFGPAGAPIQATASCSGSDALALCVAAVLAYPSAWRTRLIGATGGIALILGLNTIRIGTLGRAAGSQAWFTALHVYVWPAVLTLSIAGYAFFWMRLADRAPAPGALVQRLEPSRRFVGFTFAFLVIFLAASPLYLDSAVVLALAGVVARGAATVLGLAGIGARATANALWTTGGGVLVTQECIATPLIPVYLGAVCAYASTWRRLAFGLAATLPIFVTLGVARLLLVALPSTISSPLFLVHAFYQLLFGAIIVWLAAAWRHGSTATRHAAAGVLSGAVLSLLLASALTRAGGSVTLGAGLADPQGAIASLPAYEIALYVALWVASFPIRGWGRFAAGLALLGLTLTTTLLALHAFSVYADMALHVRDVRALAVIAPVVIFAAMVHDAPTRC